MKRKALLHSIPVPELTPWKSLLEVIEENEDFAYITWNPDVENSFNFSLNQPHLLNKKSGILFALTNDDSVFTLEEAINLLVKRKLSGEASAQYTIKYL